MRAALLAAVLVVFAGCLRPDAAAGPCPPGDASPSCIPPPVASEPLCLEGYEDCEDHVGLPADESPPEPPPSDAPRHVGPFTLRTLAWGSSSGIDDARRVVLREPDAYAAVWATHASRHAEPPAAPPVDWSREVVVAAYLGTKGDGCWAIRIENVTNTPQGFQVEVVTYDAHAPDMACTQALTQAHHLVALSGPIGGDATFAERTRTGTPHA